jgi:FKBP-type peptidyl-prolyl cis-trans isomerase
MLKKGIKVISDNPGSGPELRKGDRVRVRYDIQLSRGDYLAKDQESDWVVGDREMVAGFRYGLDGMRIGGTRAFRASPHLCYGDSGTGVVPKNAVLIVTIKKLDLEL